MRLRTRAIIFIALFALLCWLFTIPVEAQVPSQALPEPTLLAEWQGDTLVVIASPGSLYLVGGDLEEQYIGQELVTLPASGGDAQYTPIGRGSIELRNQNGVAIAAIPIPDKPYAYTVILPIIIR